MKAVPKITFKHKLCDCHADKSKVIEEHSATCSAARDWEKQIEWRNLVRRENADAADQLKGGIE